MSSPTGNHDKNSGENSEATKKKLFFALQPHDELRRQLVNLQQQSIPAQQGRPVAAENLHITLVFLGLTDESQQFCAQKVAAEVTVEPFDFTLDKVGHWAKPRILWAGASIIPEPMMLLVSRISTGVQACGIKLDDRSYRPHVTLARKIGKRPGIIQMTPLTWAVSHFELMESVFTSEGVIYKSVASWPLG